MHLAISIDQLLGIGLTHDAANDLLQQLNRVEAKTPEAAWEIISKHILKPTDPFTLHLFLFTLLFPTWRTHPETASAWRPPTACINNSNIFQFMQQKQFSDLASFHRWTTDHYQDFWEAVTQTLPIVFKQAPEATCVLQNGIQAPIWFPHAKMNIIDSCFTAQKNAIAILYQDKNKKIQSVSYEALNALSNQIANSLIALGYKAGDAIAVTMPMNHYAVAIYLGIIKMGGVVVSIADSFSEQEIAVRLKITNAKAVFTQDAIFWANKPLPLYTKIANQNAPKIIVLPFDQTITIPLRATDITWDNFLLPDTHFDSTACDPMDACNILFSSGTTTDPKAIVWNHTTPIKAASDAYFHQNIQAGDVLTWPTNLGWMMGPWLIYAALINKATIALYTQAPKDRAFGEFIEEARVTMLGVVPTLVSTWRQSACMEGLNWQTIKTFSSTGECSNPEDMLYLMSLAGYQPIIEYCGGTEIGGAYVSSTVIEPNYPSLFTTPTMGFNFTILDEAGHVANVGEVAIIPPSIGLSTQLLNANHEEVYFKNMPTTPDGKILRRHGDQMKRFANGCYSILGRADDTMNLGGIKISAAEIERVLSGFPDIMELAAIAITPPSHGPSLLVIYAATEKKLEVSSIKKDMQKRINAELNPLFKIHDVVLMNELPKTVSNKIMRRVLRKNYIDNMNV